MNNRRLGCGPYLLMSAVVFVILTLIEGYLLQYGLSAWLLYLGKDAVPYWPCVAVAVIPIIGQLTIPFAAITFIIMLAL